MNLDLETPMKKYTKLSLAGLLVPAIGIFNLLASSTDAVGLAAVPVAAAPPAVGGLVGTWPIPTAPAGNPQQPDRRKQRLGKLLFWDEQVSSDRTIACGTCHIPAAGGSDPRTRQHPATSDTPQAFGSPGVIRQDEDGDYVVDAEFQLSPQITGRLSPSPFGAAFFQKLFWKATAGPDFTFTDVNGVQQTLTEFAALEDLSVQPPLSPVEMAHDDETWDDIVAKLATLKPVALAVAKQGEFDIPPSLTYADLFESAFGSPGVTRGRFAMAVAAYMRELIPNEAPIDGDLDDLSSSERLGLDIFRGQFLQVGCSICHATFDSQGGIELETDTNGTFFKHANDYLLSGGVLEDAEGINSPDDPVKITTLRNIALMPRLTSLGMFAGIEHALDTHYLKGDQGGQTQFGTNFISRKQDILAFFDALVDPRVAQEEFPFDRPKLYSEHLAEHPNLLGEGNWSGSQRPLMIANAPPKTGNADWKLGVGLMPEGSMATLFVSDAMAPKPGSGMQLELDQNSASFVVVDTIAMNGITDVPGMGVGTYHRAIPDVPQLVGMTLYYQWAIPDTNAFGGFACSQVAKITFY